MIRGLIGENVGGGIKKDATSKLLDFELDGHSEFSKVAYEHYFGEKDMLVWMRGESDELVHKVKDSEVTSYSRMAGNVAELVQKYVKVYPRWKEINEADPQKYAQFDNELQRHMGSHQTVTESFLMKVVDKVEGEEGVNRLIKSMPSENGFDYSEGYSVVIGEGDKGVELKVRYKDKEWEVTPEIIEEIIRERDELNESIKSANN